MYVPTLAEAIVKAQKAGTWTGAPLAGIAVGNGCSGSEVGVCAQSDEYSYFRWTYLQQTAFISSSTKAAIASSCNWTAAHPNPSPSCAAVLQNAAKSISHINLYNVYGDCISGAPPLPRFRVPLHLILPLQKKAAALFPTPPFAPPAKSPALPPAVLQRSSGAPTPASTRAKQARTSTARTSNVSRSAPAPAIFPLGATRLTCRSRHPRESPGFLLVSLQVSQPGQPACAASALDLPLVR